MRTLVAVAASLMLAAASCNAISTPTQLSDQSWSTTYNSRWYTLDTGITDLLLEGTTSNTIARQISTGTIRTTWTAFDGDDYRILDGSGTSSLNRVKLFSFSSGATILNVKTLSGSVTTPTFTQANWTLPNYQTSWTPMTSVAGVVYYYSGRYLIGVQASNGALLTNMSMTSSISSTAKAVGYAYNDGAKFLTFRTTNYNIVTVDIRRNYVTMNCAQSSILSSSSFSYSDAYPAFAPYYSSGSSTMYPLIFAWGPTSTYSYGAAVNATPGSTCTTMWRRATSTSNIRPLQLEGSRTSIRPGMPFTFISGNTNNAIYTSYASSGDDGRLVWLNYRTGLSSRDILVDSSISVFTDDQCSASLMVGPSIVDTSNNLLLSFDMYLYQYSSSTTTSSYTWRYSYGSVFGSFDDVDDAGCAPWRYKVVSGKTLFITNSGNAEMAAMAIGSGSSSDPGTSSSSSSGSTSYSSYSPYYKVSLTSGLTGTSARTAIIAALSNKYGITSSSFSGWSYNGAFTTFRIWYGTTKSTAESNTASGLQTATTSSTLRSELGFATCVQTVDPFGAAVAAAFGTLFLVLILIGVALVICVVAIIVCCCCCTAKAVADASAPPQQTVVMANQAAYVPMNQQVGQPGQVGYAQPGYAQPGQVQGGAML